MITASIVTYNNHLLDIEMIIHSLMISPVQKVWIIDHSDSFRSLSEELSEFKRIDSSFKEHAKRGFEIDYIFHENNGYGGGHNIAIGLADRMGSTYHLVVNPDVWFDENVIPTIWKHMEDNPDIAQIMPKVLFLTGQVQYLAKLLPTPFDLFGRFFLPSYLIERRNNKFELRQYADQEMNVPYLSGCFMFFRLKSIKEINFFDDSFFMYAEDVDITRRLHRKYRTVYFPQVSIYHKFNRASHRNFHLFVIHTWNMMKYFWKWGWFIDRERHKFNRQLLKEMSEAE